MRDLTAGALSLRHHRFPMSNPRHSWAAVGDINAFFGLMLDNIANLLLTVGLLSRVFGFPARFALRYMIPGTAMGVLVGDLLFFWMALRLTRRRGVPITAMPLGLDTPSTFGMIFFVLGPAFLAARQRMSIEDAALHTWHLGICSIFLSGIFKLICAYGSNWVRRAVPRAGLLGSLAAIALVLISFLPLLELLRYPVVGLVSLSIILTALVARISTPFRIPGALAALLVGSAIYYLMQWTGCLVPEPAAINAREGLLPTEWLSALRFEWLGAMREALNYLPIVIPFALATVVGGIDCTESAAAAGDEFDTGQVIAIEGFATIVASLCGGVIQSTPYIGHPAYKAMGARAAYTLATALFVGSAGLLGYFGYLYVVIPKVTVFPILIFVGLEITSQSFQATPRRHYPAVALACVPALASLALLFIDKLLSEMAGKGLAFAQLGSDLQGELTTVRVLASGFVLTSLLWASALAALIDRKLVMASACFAIAAFCALFGVIHSPLPGSPLFLPWQLDSAAQATPVNYGLGYLGMAITLLVWRAASRREDLSISPEEENRL